MELPRLCLQGFFHSDLSYGNAGISQPRRVERYELEMILEDGDRTVINDRVYPLRKNTLIAAKPGDVRYSCFSKPMQSMYLRLEAEGLCAQRLAALPDCFPAIHTAQLHNLFREVISLGQRERHDPLLLGGKLLQLIYYLSSDAAIRADGAEKLYPIVHQAKAYMEANYRLPLNTAAVARQVNLSESYLRGLYRRVYGCTVADYLRQVRLSIAARLLSGSALSIGQVAEASGFGSVEYFTTVFRKTMGVTPGEYRREAVRQNRF